MALQIVADGLIGEQERERDRDREMQLIVGNAKMIVDWLI